MSLNRFRLRTNAFLHGVSAGFGIARLLSAPIRKWYDVRYRPRHRFPSLVFVFDLALLSTVAALVILIITLFMAPPAPPSLRLSLSAPPIASLAPVAITARVSPSDRRDHGAVSIRWSVPNGWEILAADPPMRADGTVFIGDLPEDSERVSRVVLRPYAQVGTEATINVSVSHIVDGLTQTYVGSETYPVTGSALVGEIPPAFRAALVAKSGVILPIVVSNRSDRAIPSVEVRPVDSGTIAFPRVTLGDLPPQSSRVVYVELGELREPLHLAWGVFAASREIADGAFDAAIASAAPTPAIDEPIIARANASTSVRVRDAAETTLLVVGPASTGTVLEYAIASNDETVVVPPERALNAGDDRWLIASVRTSGGTRTLGPGTFGTSRTSFPFSASVTYTTPFGDQIGAGPNPPRVGEETRYWVFWRIGPVQQTLTDINVEASLGPGVTITGNSAPVDGGTSRLTNDRVRWHLDRLGLETGKSEAAFGFEIAITPSAAQEGEAVELIGPSKASAREETAGLGLEAENGAYSSEKIMSGPASLLHVE